MASDHRILLLVLSLSVATSLVAGQVNQCDFEIIESMPDGLQLGDPNDHFHTTPTHEALLRMINNSKETLRIASFYWMMTAEKEFEDHPAVVPGKSIQEAISKAVSRGVNLEVILDGSSRNDMSNREDVEFLERLGTVRRLNMSQAIGGGVLHSKFLVADNDTVYIGSSNFDWRSYTEIKEMGIGFYNCQAIAVDLDKIFQTYMLVAELGHVPARLPDHLNTTTNIDHPFELTMNGMKVHLFLGGSPPPFNGDAHPDSWVGRTDDIDGLLHIIDGAKHRVSISVMNYSPRMEFGWPKKYWPRIDDALRRAAVERRVQVRLLFSNWSHSKPLEEVWYKSLNSVQSKFFGHGGIHVKLFQVPAFDDFQRSIPFSRVKHDKYLVADNGLYIGTSNWTPDYFINTCGVSVVIRPSDEAELHKHYNVSVIKNMQDLFDRDFESQYAHELGSGSMRRGNETFK